MSMYINFEEHSWYFGHAIKANKLEDSAGVYTSWESIYYDGVKGRWIERDSDTLKGLKIKIKKYRNRVQYG